MKNFSCFIPRFAVVMYLGFVVDLNVQPSHAQEKKTDPSGWREIKQSVRQELDQVWWTDLRVRLHSRFEAIENDPSLAASDSSWRGLQATIKRLKQLVGAQRRLAIGDLEKSIEVLVASGMVPDATNLGARLRQYQAACTDLLDAAVRNPDEVAADLERCVHDLSRCRRELLSSVPSLAEFLSLPAHLNLAEEWESQWQTLQFDLSRREHFSWIKSETRRVEALVFPDDRDPVDLVLRRAAALARDLKTSFGVSKLSDLESELERFEALNAAIPIESTEARFVLFASVCRVRRQLAFRNPLLDFDELLFIKRHRALFNHMCDQYYGMAARPGGGLFTVSGLFGPSPKVRDVLADSVVERGRLKGQKLWGGPDAPPELQFDGEGNLEGPDHEGGTFLSPDLSYDARQVLFAYVEGKGNKRHQHHTDPARGHWAEGRVYHIFKVNLDGSNLEQLTDGTWNDFDPCWLPNGRIAFITERRGGYLRCGRTCPTYTLFDMAADGSDITCLSFHETNEWHPSVTPDGRIIYTRWDYVDRHGVTAHFPWITTLDGRDSRAVHGNFAPRHLRPDMELDSRAVPGSHKFIATAAPHHGQAYGSLVLIDPQVPDDDAMGPVKRLTPDVGFPETQKGQEAFGTAWPLNEDYFLCAYDPETAMGQGRTRGNYGIYLVDAFGNKELLYRDPRISSQSPIPVRPVARPRTETELIQRGPETNPTLRPSLLGRVDPAEGTVAVLNVYDSLKPWPEGTKITHLRVLQVLPMTVPSGAPPHNTGLRAASASDSVVPVRYVLGTAPVESDGSAHFIVPANKEIFFQALDAEGLAVQSMRSSTYLHKGQQLVCVGCHEPKSRAPVSIQGAPLALQRAPSRLTPDVDGSNPFSYPRLVQPVLDRKCVQCHEERSKDAPNLAREPIARGWYASYNSLVQKFGFHEYDDRYRSTPGHFGARASRLYALLEKGHYDVQLDPEEKHRLTLWLDCMSMFYGVYEKEGAEAQLRGEIVYPTLE